MKSFTLLFLVVLIGSVWATSVTTEMDQNGPDQISEGVESPEQALHFFDSFEAYVPFTPICTQTTNWIPWGGVPGAADDPLVSNAQAYSGLNSVVILQDDDLVWEIGAPVTTGLWRLSFQMYIPSGKAGYFNTLTNFGVGGVGAEWAMQVFFNVGGTASLDAGGAGAATFPYAYDIWQLVEVIIDLDNDLAELWLAGSLIYSWQYTLGTFGTPVAKQFDANDFYGATANDEMYIDDYAVEEIVPDLLFSDNFDGYTPGTQLVVQNPVFWDTWSGGGGTSEDPMVSNAQSFSASNSVVITSGNDLVKTLGSQTTGKWYIDFWIYIPNGKAGYFNTMAVFSPPSTFDWGMDVFLDVGGGGRLIGVPGAPINFSYTYDTWHSVGVVVDLDIDSAQFWFDNTMVSEWQWTQGGTITHQLDASDFWGATGNDEMYVDNYYISQAPPLIPASIGIDPSAIDDTVAVGDSIDVIIEISNTAVAGAVALDWSAAVIYTTSQTTLTMIANDEAKNAKILAVGKPVSLERLEALRAAAAINPESVPDVGAPFENFISGITHVEGVMGEEVFGSTQNAYGPLGTRGRGNHFYCTTSTTLTEHRLYLNMTVDSDMQFLVYEGSAQVGTYNLINATEIASSGTGQGWYSSGPINVPMVAGNYYLIYPQWTQPANYYNEQNISPYPIPASFGELQMGVGFNWAPPYSLPAPATHSVPSTAFGVAVAYYQTIVTGTPLAQFIELLEPTSGSVDPGDVQNLTARIYGLDVADTTYSANIEIISNDPQNPTVTIPVEIYVPPVVGINDPNQAPYTFAISQNYPNPFNPSTTIKYQLPQSSRVTISVYNLLGQKIRTLVNDNMEAGDHQVTWNGANDAGAQVGSGVYFYRFQADDFVSIKKMMFLK